MAELLVASSVVKMEQLEEMEARIVQLEATLNDETAAVATEAQDWESTPEPWADRLPATVRMASGETGAWSSEATQGWSVRR